MGACLFINYRSAVFTIAISMALATTMIPRHSSAARLSKTDPIVQGALECTRHFPRYERTMSIPTHLLSAIASTESGRFHKGLKMSLPWPWTISAGGKGQYFATKQEAVAAVKKLQARGISNIDVGCMQVNMHHHADAFDSIEQAFEPRHNIAYAAKFLRRLYDEHASWKQAASDYHSRTPSLGRKYVNRVYNSWYSIITKLRDAQVAVPSSSLAAMQSMKSDHNTTRLASIPPTARVERLHNDSKRSNVNIYRVPHSHEISIRPSQTQQTTADALAIPATTNKPLKSADIRSVNRSNIIVVHHPSAQNTTSTAPQNTNPAPAIPVQSAPTPQQGAASGAPIPPAVAPPVLAATAAGQPQTTITVNAPLDPIANAALMPASGIINAAAQKMAASFQTPPSQPMPTRTSEPAHIHIDYAARRATEASYAQRDGPRFIFSQ